MSSQEQLSDLFSRFLENSCSREEVAILLHYFGEKANADSLTELIREELNRMPETRPQLAGELADATWNRIRQELPSSEVLASVSLKWYKRKWVQAAAMIVLLLSAGGMYFLNLPAASEKPLVANALPGKFEAILPGSEKAILTLSDGRQLVLDDSLNGVLATQGAAQIIKKADGQIQYAASETPPGEAIYNTMQTPRGGQYRLVLPDGTRVWLNAASSIRYPVSFDKKERRVEVSGEVFFDVAHDKSHPFMVIAGNTSVRVLGTSFNINAYVDEPWQITTLVEGAITMEKGQEISRLRPGQQARIAENKPIAVAEAKDLDEVIAWKNGLFIFNSQDVRTVMRQISRWYDVEVVYQGARESETFSGIVSRTSSIDQVLKIMETGGVKFKLEGKKLIVTQ